MHSEDIVEIRRAIREDISGIAGTYVASAEFHRRLAPTFYRVPSVESIAQEIEREWGDPDKAVFVAHVGDEVVGSADVSIDRARSGAGMVKSGTVANVGVSVLEPHRRKGLGRELMCAAEEWAVSQGAEKMMLDCHPSNGAAIALYQELGYRTTGVLMQKPLHVSGLKQPH